MYKRNQTNDVGKVSNKHIEPNQVSYCWKKIKPSVVCKHQVLILDIVNDEIWQRENLRGKIHVWTYIDLLTCVAISESFDPYSSPESTIEFCKNQLPKKSLSHEETSCDARQKSNVN